VHQTGARSEKQPRKMNTEGILALVAFIVAVLALIGIVVMAFVIKNQQRRIKELLEELDAQCNKHRAEQDNATLQQYKIALHEENASTQDREEEELSAREKVSSISGPDMENLATRKDIQILPLSSPAIYQESSRRIKIIDQPAPAKGPSPAESCSEGSEQEKWPGVPKEDEPELDRVFLMEPEDVRVKADIGFSTDSNKYQAVQPPQTLWTPPRPMNKWDIDGEILGRSPCSEARKVVNISVQATPGNLSSRARRQGQSNGSSIGSPLSARGIDPEKHPELHAKELAEMIRLVHTHCQDTANVISRTEIRCLWCHETFTCPPYRPQGFYFRDIQNRGEHNGHLWSCQKNPNISLQSGRGIPVGDGKILI